MDWKEAEALIYQHIVAGVNLNPELGYREVVQGPYYSCSQYDYDGGDGYLVQIGANSFIEIPFSMLENVFEAALANDGIYENKVFSDQYPDQAESDERHVHVVGKIFEMAGIAESINKRQYRIIEESD